jgi:integrase/recombinase XerD
LKLYARVLPDKNLYLCVFGFTSADIDWDESNSCPRPSHPKFKAVIKKLGDLTEAVEFEVRLSMKNGVDIFSLAEIKNKIKAPAKKISKVKILEFYGTVIKELEEEGRVGYSNTFVSSLGSLKKFLNGADKSFVAFSKENCENYEKFLLDGINEESTVSVYLRTFYRLWNIAVERGICPKEHHPSKYIKFKPYRKFKTKKRALSANVISSIEKLGLEKDSREFRSQQFFLFSYYARGINFIDIAKLRSANLKGTELTYIRSKNKRRYQYILHSKAVAIIKLFAAGNVTGENNYLFPILKNEHDTPKKIDARVDSALKDMNEDLDNIAKMLGLEKKLTSYVARHSFATNLRSKNVNISIIQEAMGHETELQTMTYLDEIDDSIVAKSIEDALE